MTRKNLTQRKNQQKGGSELVIGLGIIVLLSLIASGAFNYKKKNKKNIISNSLNTNEAQKILDDRRKITFKDDELNNSNSDSNDELSIVSTSNENEIDSDSSVKSIKDETIEGEYKEDKEDIDLIRARMQLMAAQTAFTKKKSPKAQAKLAKKAAFPFKGSKKRIKKNFPKKTKTKRKKKRKSKN